MRTQPRLHTLALAAGLGLLASNPALAEAWSFGVLGDSQWTKTADAINVNTVAVKQIVAANQAFVAAGVKFVMQPGDLGDNGSVASLATRLDANFALDAAGIPFYALRGNHDNQSATITYFQDNYIPTTTTGTTVELMSDGKTYSVATNGLKLLMLDYAVTGSTTLLPTATTWMGQQLAAADHTHAIVVGHKNLLGQNHKDNLFGSANESNTALQDAFISTAASGGARYYIGGHDHMHHRSTVASPDGSASLQQIITQSNSSKWYTPRTPYSTRETPISQDLYNIGYYLYTVDGPRLSAKYYSTAPVNSDIADNPVWTLQETFGYSLNGSSKMVAQGESYAMTHRIEAGSSHGESGYVGTAMAILGGTNTSTETVSGGRATEQDVNIGWSSRALAGGTGALSDVLTIWGMEATLGSARTDTYALSLSFDAAAVSAEAAAAGQVFLGWLDAGGSWVNAVQGNTGSPGSFVLGSWDPTYSLGSWGVDLAHGTAWAVLDHGGEFGVLAAVPEPQTWLLMAGGIAFVLRRAYGRPVRRSRAL